MDAFGTMDSGGATIEHLAPGVSGALLTTVAALLVAIPIVFAYNGLLGTARSCMTKLENFASNLADRIEIEQDNASFFKKLLINKRWHEILKRPNKLAVISDLNVTPLIDLAFSLLIIFMITTPVIEQYNRIDLPNQDSISTQKPPDKEDKFISIDSAGEYNWGQDAVSKNELESLLDQVAQDIGEQPTIHVCVEIELFLIRKLWMLLICLNQGILLN